MGWRGLTLFAASHQHGLCPPQLYIPPVPLHIMVLFFLPALPALIVSSWCRRSHIALPIPESHAFCCAGLHVASARPQPTSGVHPWNPFLRNPRFSQRCGWKAALPAARPLTRSARQVNGSQLSVLVQAVSRKLAKSVRTGSWGGTINENPVEASLGDGVDHELDPRRTATLGLKAVDMAGVVVRALSTLRDLLIGICVIYQPVITVPKQTLRVRIEVVSRGVDRTNHPEPT